MGGSSNARAVKKKLTEKDALVSEKQTSVAKLRNGVSKRSGRGRNGCLNCRRRRKKCDESKPDCAKCTSRGEVCEWDSGITFRLTGIDAQHPSMLQARAQISKPPESYQIMKVTFDGNKISSKIQEPQVSVNNAYENSTPSSSQRTADEDEIVTATSAEDQVRSDDDHGLEQSLTSSPPVSNFDQVALTAANQDQWQDPESNTASRPTVPQDGNSHIDFADQHISNLDDVSQRQSYQTDHTSHEFSVLDRSTKDPMDNSNQPEAPSATLQASENSIYPATYYDEQPQFDAADLEVLDYLTSNVVDMDMFTSPVRTSNSKLWDNDNQSNMILSPQRTNSITGESPDEFNIWYPNPTYKKLHTTLYHHMVRTARNTVLSRQGTPERLQLESSAMSQDAPMTDMQLLQRPEPQNTNWTARSLSPVKLDERRQLKLWRNYLDEIAVWLDMFDSQRHFQFQIPILAKNADHLHYAILALSARQLERKDPDKPHTESLHLYQEAIQLVVKELHTVDTAVIASCVLLCVLEMMSSAPLAWGRHLDGCAMLLQAAGVNGVVGGVRQALFWCFARMDVWGGFLGDTITKIPTSRWSIPTGSMADAVSHFRAGSGGDIYANYAVFLCAKVVNVISNKIASCSVEEESSASRQQTFPARWKALFDLLEDWYNNRPEDMQPLMSSPARADDHLNPFPIVLYSTSPAINGNQLYHAATILLLQNKPHGIRFRKAPKSILWHACQICGIASSNYHHGPWINALQPLWIAGKLMSHRTQHQAIIEILTRIERETGWATTWRIQDLRDYWGEPDY